MKEIPTFRNARVICAMLAIVVALAVVIALHQLRQHESTTEQARSRETVPSPSRGAENNPPKELAIPPDATVKKLVQAWNGGKVEQIADMFASDAVLIMPAGSQIESRAAIRKTLAEKQAGVLKDTRLANSVEDVLQPDADSAIVKGTYRLEGISALGATSGSYVLQQIKRDGQWLISKAQVTSGNEG